MANRPKTPKYDEVIPRILLRYSVPADNSCLFTSVYFGISNGQLDNSASYSLRVIIADTVASDPQTYNETYLDQTNESYCRWILKEDNWGGAIELSILSNYYKIEIVVVNIESSSLHRFGEDKIYDERILLIYDGVHYDPLMFQSFQSEAVSQTLFPISDTSVLDMALELAREIKYSASPEKKNLKCFSCCILLDDKNHAQNHYKETGHYLFYER